MEEEADLDEQSFIVVVNPRQRFVLISSLSQRLRSSPKGAAVSESGATRIRRYA